MKDAPTPNLTSLATSVRPLAAILQTIFQFSWFNISGTARHKFTKFGEAIELNIFYIFSKFMILSYSIRLYNAKTFSCTQAHISEYT